MRAYGVIILGVFVALSFLGWYATRDMWFEYEAYRTFVARTYPLERAYDRFAEYAVHLDESVAHAQIHQFAGILYERYGADSIRVCDERFAQGCAHEILGRTIQEFGVSSIPDVQAACASAFAEGAYFCDHGVGHGLANYYGYDKEEIDQAIAYCDEHEKQDPLRGCYTGVFMEYFLQNVRYSGSEPRALSVEHGYVDICPQFSGVARWICFYKLPLWWHQLARSEGVEDGGDLVQDMYAHCVSIETEAEQLACLHGLGHVVAPMAGYEKDLVETLCASINTSFRDHLICISDAAYNILLEKREPRGVALCDAFVGTAHDYCIAYATTMAQREIRIRAIPTENR